MKHLIPTYCDSGFFDFLVNKKIDLIDFTDGDAIRSGKTHLELAQFIFKGANVFTNLSFEKISQSQNPFLKYLYKNSRLKFFSGDITPTTLHERNNFSPFTIFLFDRPEEDCCSIERAYGYYCLNYRDEKRLSRLFRFQVEPFKRQQTKAWSFIDNYAEPLNSLIICDPYLINADGPNDNLYNILEGFLSGSIEGDVDVTFITTSKNFKIGDETWDQANQRFLKHWEQQKMRLRNRLGDNLNFSVVLYKGAELHDRFLITNNLMVYSGFSFNSLIDHQTAAPKKQTSWMIVRHAKMQDSNIPNGEKTHFHTAVGFIEDINRWIKNGKAEVFTDTETLYCNRLLTDHDVRSRA